MGGISVYQWIHLSVKVGSQDRALQNADRRTQRSNQRRRLQPKFTSWCRVAPSGKATRGYSVEAKAPLKINGRRTTTKLLGVTCLFTFLSLPRQNQSSPRDEAGSIPPKGSDIDARGPVPITIYQQRREAIENPPQGIAGFIGSLAGKTSGPFGFPKIHTISSAHHISPRTKRSTTRTILRFLIPTPTAICDTRGFLRTQRKQARLVSILVSIHHAATRPDRGISPVGDGSSAHHHHHHYHIHDGAEEAGVTSLGAHPDRHETHIHTLARRTLVGQHHDKDGLEETRHGTGDDDDTAAALEDAEAKLQLVATAPVREGREYQ